MAGPPAVFLGRERYILEHAWKAHLVQKCLTGILSTPGCFLMSRIVIGEDNAGPSHWRQRGAFWITRLSLPGTGQGENQLKQCQQEADQVTEIMLDNYTKVIDREGKLSDLDERAEELRKQSTAFTKTTKTLAQKKRWENVRFKIILVLVVVLLLVIVTAIILYFTLSGSGNQGAPAQASAGGD